MELIKILLSSVIGALLGTSVGIFLLYRKLRPITGAELDLTRGKLRSTEFSLSSATAALENLRKQSEEHEQQLAAAQEKTREAEAAAAVLHQQIVELENRAEDETRTLAETASRQIASYESQIEADDRQIKELSGQVARLTSELEQLKGHLDQETDGRTTLENQLSMERDHSRRLASRIAEMESERSHFDLTLQEERQSAAKGIELLLMAQENLARVFRPAAPEIPGDSNGNGHALVGAIAGDATSE